MASSGSISKADLNNLKKRFDGKGIDEMFLSSLFTNPNKLSGSRVHMFSLHKKKCIMPDHPEVPYVYTGYEKAFGKRSDGFKQADSDYQIVAKIHRHTELPNVKYLLVLRDLVSGVYTVEEVSHYESLAEMHGYIRPETKTDHLPVGSIIRKNDYFYKASSIDDHGNYMYGLNAKVAFVNTLNCVADAVFISDEFAKRASYHTVEETEILLNLNDVLLNLHGTKDYYKSLPSIGEDISDSGILCARRKIDFDLAFSNLTDSGLMNLLESDEIFKGKGKIVDIDIFVNKPQDLLNNTDPFRNQIKFLYQDQLRYHREIYDALLPIISNNHNKYTYNLRHYFDLSRNYISNTQLETTNNVVYATNNGPFEFIHLVIKIAQKRDLQYADKLTNRSAAKGVISTIIPKEYMFRDEYGNYCDVCFAGKGIIGRLNIAQVYEHELNFIANRIVHKMKNIIGVEERFSFLIDFINHISTEQATELKSYWKKLKHKDKEEFIQSIIDDGQIYIYQPPFDGNITLEQMEALYDHYEIEPGYARFKMKFKKEKYHHKKYMSEAEFNRNQMMLNYLYDEEVSQRQSLTIDKYIEAVRNNDILTRDDGLKFVKSDVIYDASARYRSYTKTNLWERIAKEVEVVKSVFTEMNSKEFNSTKTRTMIDENGDIIKDFRTIRKMIIAPIYVLLLKQIADTGFSARSLDAVNHLGTPIKKGKIDIGYAYNNSPIAFSFMDICNTAIRVPIEIVHRFKSMTASNPELRQEMAEVLLTRDPLKLHDLATKVEETYDVPARMLKAYFWGLYIGFLEGHEKDPFAKYDSPEYFDLNRVFNKYHTIDVDPKTIRKDFHMK